MAWPLVIARCGARRTTPILTPGVPLYTICSMGVETIGEALRDRIRSSTTQGGAPRQHPLTIYSQASPRYTSQSFANGLALQCGNDRHPAALLPEVQKNFAANPSRHQSRLPSRVTGHLRVQRVPPIPDLKRRHTRRSFCSRRKYSHLTCMRRAGNLSVRL